MNRLNACVNQMIVPSVALLLAFTTLAQPMVRAQDAPDQPQAFVPPAPPVEQFRITSTPTTILAHMAQLEATQGVKSHAEAARAEDALWGTPLTDQARVYRYTLQKDLARKIWTGASRHASVQRQTPVNAAHIQPFIDQIYRVTPADNGDLLVTFEAGVEVTLTQRRVDQYSSIPFAHRAVLGVQQEFYMTGGEIPVSLSPDGVGSLAGAVNIVTLCALQLADERARETGVARMNYAAIRTAWIRLIPLDMKLVGAPDEKIMIISAAEAPKQHGQEMFGQIIPLKVQACRIAHPRDEGQLTLLMLQNMKQFYARYPVPLNPQAQMQMLNGYNFVVSAFTRRLISEAATRAEQAGHPLISASDAEAAVDVLLPQTIDALGDVHLFTDLSADRHVTLEWSDCDSIRRTGRHWVWLGLATQDMPQLTRVPDPQAAEVLAEAVSQYSVLLPRVAGRMARARQDTLHLTPQYFKLAAVQIKDMAEEHRANPAAEDPQQADGDPAPDAPQAEGAYFTDVTGSAGVTYRHRSSDWLNVFRRAWVQPSGRIDKMGIPTFSGGGVAAEDIDGDGDIDLLFVGGGGIALMDNDGQGGFTDTTEAAGLDVKRADGATVEARQPIIVVFDNDGVQDILITCVNDDHRLFRGLGDGKFEDVTATAGLGGTELIGSAATAFDFDNDGRLDVYITYFGNYLNGDIPFVNQINDNALPNKLFRNVGPMRFEEVTDGMHVSDTAWAQAVTHTDFDQDGRQDLIVANDFGLNAFLQNMGGGKFENVSMRYGIRPAYHSTNVGTADLNHDGSADVYISNIATLIGEGKYPLPHVNSDTGLDYEKFGAMDVKESSMLYVSAMRDDELIGYNPSEDIDLGGMSTGWAWGAEFLDFDNDGDDDLYVVNGSYEYSIYDVAMQLPGEADAPPVHYLITHDRERNVLLVNEDGKLVNHTDESGAAGFAGNSRSTAYLDYDRDGDLDIAVNSFHSPATLLRNNSETRGHGWISVRLIGDPMAGVNRDAVGARLELTGPDGLQVSREIQGGSGHLSMNPKTQHFGVGAAKTVNVTIIWPNGETQTHSDLAVNQPYTIQLGEADPQ